MPKKSDRAWRAELRAANKECRSLKSHLIYAAEQAKQAQKMVEHLQKTAREHKCEDTRVLAHDNWVTARDLIENLPETTTKLLKQLASLKAKLRAKTTKGKK